MKRISFLLVIFLVIGFFGCSEDNQPAAPTVNPPSDLTASALSFSEIHLTWTHNTGEVSFVVERSRDGSNYSPLAETEAEEYTDSGLLEGSTFYYRVQAVSGGATSDYSTPVNATTPPIEPSDLTVTDVKSSEVTLSWRDNSHVEDGFRLQRRLSSAPIEEYEEIVVLSADVTSYTDTLVEPDRGYNYRLHAFKGETATGWSEEVSAITAIVPTDLVASVISDSEIELSWTDVSSREAGYKLERRTAEVEEWTVVEELDADVTGYNDSGLDEATTFTYHVITVLEAGESSPSDPVTATTMPKAPTGFTAAQDENSPTTIILSWTDVSSAEDRYELQRKIEGPGQFQAFANPPANTESYSDAGLMVNTTYIYRVRAAVGSNVSSWSDEVSISTTILTPAQPSGLAVDSIAYSLVVLSWSDNSDNEDGFILERSRERFQNYTVVDSIPADQTVYTDTGLEPLTDYFYRVSAYNEFGDSDLSDVLRITTLEGPPTAPENLTAPDFGYGYIRLRWDDTSDNEAGFKVDRRDAPDGDWVELLSIPANVDSCVDHTVSPVTTYNYRVHAFNYIGVSDYSNVVEVTTPIGPPIPPTNLDSVGATLESIEISWDDNSDDEEGFNIYRRLPPSYAWGPIARVNADLTTFIDYDVVPATAYAYLVNAYNEAGDSDWSNELIVHTPVAPPGAPYELGVTPVGLREMELEWMFDTDDETHFVIERRDDQGGEFDSVGFAPRRYYSYVDTGLVPDEFTYWYRVKAVNGGGSGDYSNIVEVQTPQFNPPSNISATAVRATEIQVDWSPGPYYIDHFILESRDEPEGDFEQITDTPDSSFRHTGLIPDEHQYWYRVKSFVGQYESGWSDIATATTPPIIAFQDDFEDHELDQPPGDPWEYDNQDPSYIHVSDDDQHEGDQSLNFHDPADNDNPAAYCRVVVAFDDVGYGSVDFWLKLSEGGTFGFDALSSPEWNTGIEYLCWFFPNEIRTNNGNNWATVNYQYTPDEWFHIVFNHDADEDVFSVTIDDEVIFQDYGMVFGRPINHLWWLCFSDQNMDDAWMDDLFVRNTVEEEERIMSGPVRRKSAAPLFWYNPDNLPTSGNR